MGSVWSNMEPTTHSDIGMYVSTEDSKMMKSEIKNKGGKTRINLKVSKNYFNIHKGSV